MTDSSTIRPVLQTEILKGLEALRWLEKQGARFCKVSAWNSTDDSPGKNPNVGGKGWETKPLTVQEVIGHINSGGNVGLLTGNNSSNIGMLDLDENYSGFCTKFPEFANCAVIVRAGGDKGKILLRVIGEIPAGTNWKRQPKEPPFMEWLSNGRMGVIPPSTHPTGMPYELRIGEGILEITPDQLSKLCKEWSGKHGLLSEKEQEPELDHQPAQKPKTYPNGDGLKENLLGYWTPRKIFDHFGMASNAVPDRQRDWIRLKGNGGLLVNRDNQTWVLAGTKGIGGGPFEAWWWCKTGVCNIPRDGFRDLLVEMAKAGGIEIPKRNNRQPPRQQENQAEQTSEGETILTSAPADHDGHAQCLQALFPDKYLYCEAYGWLYANGHYFQREAAEANIERSIVETLKARRVAAAVVEKDLLVKACKASYGNVTGTKALYQSMAIAYIDDFDREADLLNCTNGVINLRTGEILPHSKNDRFTYAVPVDYDRQADFSEWEEFLLNAVKTREMVDYLQLALGYSLTGHTWEEILFYLQGPPRSGKGTFTETILTMLGGKPLATEADFQTFTADRTGDTQSFDLAPLKPCRFVAASESNKNQPLNPAQIKRLTGRNWIYCAFKHREHFNYQPQFKIWLSSNHPVNLDVDDDAAWGRVRVIKFPESHLGSEDKSLKERLSRPEVLRGVLRWAVEGAQLWYEYLKDGGKGLPTPHKVQEDTQKQRDEQDYIQQCLDECFKTGDYVIYSSAYQAYETWCEENGVSKKGKKAFSQALARKGYQIPDVVKRVGPLAKPARVIMGLSLLEL